MAEDMGKQVARGTGGISSNGGRCDGRSVPITSRSAERETNDHGKERPINEFASPIFTLVDSKRKVGEDEERREDEDEKRKENEQEEDERGR